VRDFEAIRAVDAASSAPQAKFNIVVYSELKINIVVWPEAKVIIYAVRPEAEIFEPGWHRVICVPPNSKFENVTSISHAQI
jgi:hypothetical protein